MSTDDLSVGLHSISTGSTKLLNEPIVAYIDSGVSHIWLPLETCQRFEKQFSLTWHPGLGLYLINDGDSLSSSNANITFTLSNDLVSNTPSVTVVLPLGSLDLELTTNYPGVTNSTRYFPIRRAANSTQYVLGRAFFQHAYVIADYERHTFSVNQADFIGSQSSQLQEIGPSGKDSFISSSTNQPSKPNFQIPLGALIGAVLGSVIFVLGLGVFITFMRRQKRRARSAPPIADDQNILEIDGKARPASEVVEPIQEAVANIAGNRNDVKGLAIYYELAATETLEKADTSESLPAPEPSETTLAFSFSPGTDRLDIVRQMDAVEMPALPMSPDADRMGAIMYLEHLQCSSFPCNDVR